MTKCRDIKCRLCGRDAMQSRGYLKRVTPKGGDVEWECRPGCEGTGELNNEQKLIGAIEGWEG